MAINEQASRDATSKAPVLDYSVNQGEWPGSSSGSCHSWCRCWWRGPSIILPFSLRTMLYLQAPPGSPASSPIAPPPPPRLAAAALMPQPPTPTPTAEREGSYHRAVVS